MSLKFNEDPLFVRVKHALIQNATGLEGLKVAVRAFRSMTEVNHRNEVDPSRWRNGLRKLGVKLTDFEANYLFTAFDVSRNNLVSLDEFIRTLIGQMNSRRTSVVLKAYQKFSTKSSSPTGSIQTSELTSSFKAAGNPMIKSGVLTEEQLVRDFWAIFGDEQNPSGEVTKEEFISYYAAVSSGMAFDEQFETTVLRAWDLDDPGRPILASTKRDWSATTASGVDPLYIVKPLLHQESLNWSLADTRRTRNYDHSHMDRIFPPFVPNPSVVPDYLSMSAKSYRDYNELERTTLADPMRTKPLALTATAGDSGNRLIEDVRRKISDSWEREEDGGFLGLRRAFATIGYNMNDKVGRLEVEAAFNRLKSIKMTPVEIVSVLNYAVRNSTLNSISSISSISSGSSSNSTDNYHDAGSRGGGEPFITVNGFIRQIRGPMIRKERIAIVKAVFDALLRVQAGGPTVLNTTALKTTKSINVDKNRTFLGGISTKEGSILGFANNRGDCNTVNNTVKKKTSNVIKASLLSSSSSSSSSFPTLAGSAIDASARFLPTDISKLGRLSLSFLGQRYDPSQHPLVKRGIETRERALQNFVSVWDRNTDGAVSFEDWLEYYSDISAVVEEDHFFEVIVRNSWHFYDEMENPEAAGDVVAREVIVTRVDGSEKVVKLQNSLGLVQAADTAGYNSSDRSIDPKGTLLRLKQQGEKAITSVRLA